MIEQLQPQKSNPSQDEISTQERLEAEEQKIINRRTNQTQRCRLSLKGATRSGSVILKVQLCNFADRVASQVSDGDLSLILLTRDNARVPFKVESSTDSII